MTEAPVLHIIGVGSPYGDDTLGLQAIGRLQQERDRFPPHTGFHALDRPGSMLIPLLEEADTAVIIDAMQAQQPPGTVLRLTPDDLIREETLPSSHNLGVAETLALARVLGVMPEKLLIYGVQAGSGAALPDWYPVLRERLLEDLAPA